MRATWKTIVAASASIVLVPQLAAATDADVEEQIRLMQERLSQMEDRLQATDEQLATANERVDQQQAILQDAGLEEERSAASKLSQFLQNTEFSGWVAASYNWNVNDPTIGSTPFGNNTLGGSHNFFPQHNNFQLDEVWFSMGRAATEQNRAGFQFDIVFGQTGATMKATEGGVANGGGNDFWISQGYLEYLAPWDMMLRAGKFNTIVGYEVVGAPNNITISRGMQWGLLQPVSHVGLTLDQSFGPVDLLIGVANGFAATQPDSDQGKELLARIGMGNDMVNGSVNLIWGTDAGGSANPILNATAGGVPPASTTELTLNTVVELTPTDNIVAYMDFTWKQNRPDAGPNPWGLGLALGGRVGITDNVGVGGRFEYLRFDDDAGAGGLSALFAGAGPPLLFPFGSGTSVANMYGLTFVADYMIVDGLTLKGEMTWERASAGGAFASAIYPDSGSSGPFNNDQIIFILQMIYEF